MPGFKPLPARPNLEFEHKAAKQRLREMREADPGAKLADAQLAIAREYGFASWPKLARYLQELQRQTNEFSLPHQPQFYEQSARDLIPQLRSRRAHAARSVIAYVPRFYCRTPAEVFDADLTDDEARLATARSHGFPSWPALLERAEEVRRLRARREPPRRLDPRALGIADEAGSLDTAIARHPDQLNEFLAGGMHMKPHIVERLLEKGADPNHVMPNGMPVLEHALLRYWNGAAVDVLARRATPRRALWIAAGLGDVAGVGRFLDDGGNPIPEARQARPDFVAAGFPGAAHPEPDDEEILLEAFLVACTNGRTNVIEYLASRGFNVNTLLWDSPIINIAVGNGWTPVVAALLRCGADPDLKDRQSGASARDIARELFGQSEEGQQRMRGIVELLGLDPGRILAEREARAAPQPVAVPELTECLELAGDDAARQGRRFIEPENLLWGMLRSPGGLGHLLFIRKSRMEHERFARDHASRLLAEDDRLNRQPLTLSENAQDVMATAIAVARGLRRDVLTTAHLLQALMRLEHGGYAPQLLARYGGDEAALNPELEKMIRQ